MIWDDRLAGELVQAGRRVVRAGLVVGSGGNLSVRVGQSGAILVTGRGTWLDELQPGADGGHLAAVRVGDGQQLAGACEPTTELPLHLAVYRTRPDVSAVIHTHPQTSVLLDLLGIDIRLATTDHAFYLRRVVRRPFHPPGSIELADDTAAAVSDGTNCVVLAHHGCSVLADSVELATKRALNLEEAARLTLTARLAGHLDIPAPARYLELLAGGAARA